MQGTSSSKNRAAQPTEASFTLRRQESELSLPRSAGRSSLDVAASPRGQKAGKSRPSARADTSKKATADPRAGRSPSARPATPGEGARPAPAKIRIGVISDNHGYLDPAVLQIFAGVVHIIHAGDIVDPDILVALEEVAPVTAVGGNMDAGDLASTLPRAVGAEVAGVRFVVGHKRKRLLRDLAAGNVAGAGDAPPDLVVYGHDHVPAAAWVDGTLYLDPGSASAPHEEDDGPTVAIVEVRPAGLAVTFVPLERRDMSEAKERPKT